MENVNMEVEEEEEEEEEEDMDFNPFLRDDSPEASSSISSDNECAHDMPSTPRDERQSCGDEEVVTQFNIVNNNVTESNKDQNPNVDSNEGEDAIGKRTRARHSLVNYTLDELETFLQDSGDDADLPNVAEQEAYRKFLAAVLLDENEGRDNENVDEDEDNDVDFEIELEEALMGSDVDENVDCNDEEIDAPVTRQMNQLKKSMGKNKSTLSGQAKLPLRPILPYGSIPQPSNIPLHLPRVFPNSSPSTFGFTPNQIGQLYCLIHEHVQFLIQIFSICVLDISKQDLASEYQRMIAEMIFKREDALGRKKVAYPEHLFHYPFVCPSYQDANCINWTPQINNPVLSVLDVAPLRHVKPFLADVSDSVLSQRQSCLDVGANKNHLIKAPLFPLPSNDTSENTYDDLSAPVYSNNSEKAKKSLASMLIERTKKQTVALVPINIVRLAQSFYPLFNAALFPYKPPAQAVVNRMLFTESEDGLLAMGYMQYNNDWKAIQQRFLPCKSESQIFIRHKNRLSANAPENPIKAVRRIKTSPLTPVEMASISEGLKLLKHDWMAIWQYVVPHRDPALLPRLWRIANGTQKSYKRSGPLRERRRLYEAKRRRLKASEVDCQMLQEKEVDNGRDNNAGNVDGEDETYVHEAFLADTASRNINRSNMRSVNSSPFNVSHTKQNCASIGNGSVQMRQDLSRPTSNSRSVVKLAPNLPPVNLPPSVTVIRKKTNLDYVGKDKIATVNQSKRLWSGLSNSWQQLNDANSNASQYGAEENTSDSFRVHPLLFQTPEEYHPSYSPINFSRNPLLPDRAQYSVQSSLFGNVTNQPKSAQSDLHTIDFHPPLQRANNRNDDSTVRPSQNNIGKLFDQSTSSTNVKKNNLDLNIRLSSASDDEEILQREHQNAEKTRTEASTIGKLSLHSVPPNNGCGGYQYTGDISYDSLPGIVMEQEELSDSEEDFENVEFEREEIDDSEDEMGNEQLPNGFRNKEFSFLTSKEVEIQANQSRQSRCRKKASAQKCEKPKPDTVRKNKPCNRSTKK